MTDASSRRLAAILSADIVDYSRLMAADEDATVAAIGVRREQVTALVSQHGGRLADFVGDNFLAEFPSALQAVECALAIQAEVETHNTELAADRQVRFRIGAHLGDVRVEDDRLYGEGINIAARLEALGEAGALCLSDAVYAQVRNKLALDAKDMGEHTLKNIPQPVRAYLVRAGGVAPAPVAPASTQAAEEKPAIAVLPFDNMSGDPEQEYFADGMAEDIITDLSKVGSLLVIARNSSFTYKGKAVDVRTVAKELDVTHVVEGSVRKAGDRVRITVQLIDAGTGHHVWSERYDRTLTDIFALQDEIATEIVGELRVKLTPAETSAIGRLPTQNLEAYDLYMRGRALFQSFSPTSLPKAREMLREAYALDPSFGLPCAYMVRSYIVQLAGFPPDGAGLADEARAWGRRAVEASPNEAYCHGALALGLAMTGRPAEALPAAQRAVEINPNEAFARGPCGLALTLSGRPEEALEHVELARRLDPLDVAVANAQAFTFMGLNRLDEAYATYTWMGQHAPGFVVVRVMLCFIAGLQGNEELSREHARQLMQQRPDFVVARWQMYWGWLAEESSTWERIEAVLLAAGLPAGES